MVVLIKGKIIILCLASQCRIKIAQTVKDNTKKKNQKIMYLDSLQSVDDQKIKDGYSYLKAMKYNLKVLKKAL